MEYKEWSGRRQSAWCAICGERIRSGLNSSSQRPMSLIIMKTSFHLPTVAVESSLALWIRLECPAFSALLHRWEYCSSIWDWQSMILGNRSIVLHELSSTFTLSDGGASNLVPEYPYQLEWYLSQRVHQSLETLSGKRINCLTWSICFVCHLVESGQKIRI
jgi:hypothetical protein